jgi:malonyl-CoA O-methyltransferase
MKQTLDKQCVAARFARAARTYEQHDHVQREVATRLLERLDWVALKPRYLIDIGSGTGRCAALLAQRYRRARVMQFDLAPAMLAQARAQAPRWFSPFAFVAGDVERMPFGAARFDCAVSCLALQWVSDLDAAFSEVRRVLQDGTLFLFATLGPDTLRELRQAWARVSDHAHVNRFFDMHDVGDALLRAGFADPVMEAEYLTVNYADAMVLMRDLRGIGAGNSDRERARGMLGRNALRKVVAAYEELRRDGVLPATYEVVYGHAWAARSAARGTPVPLRRWPRR